MILAGSKTLDEILGDRLTSICHLFGEQRDQQLKLYRMLGDWVHVVGHVYGFREQGCPVWRGACAGLRAMRMIQPNMGALWLFTVANSGLAEQLVQLIDEVLRTQVGIALEHLHRPVAADGRDLLVG